MDFLQNAWGVFATLAGGLALFVGFRKNIKDVVADFKSPIVNLTNKVDDIGAKLDEHIKSSEREQVLSDRRRILRFSDEIIMLQEHTKEHYEDVLESIDNYEDYCDKHPDFPNNKCLIAIENIKEAYKERLKNNSFVTVERLVRVTKEED